MENIFQKKFWIRNIGVIIICLTVLFLFLPFIFGSKIFIGNHDRFQYWLPMQMHYAEVFRGNNNPAHFDGIFGGINTLALPSVFPNPGSWILSFLPETHFYYVSMIFSWILLVFATFFTFVYLQKLGTSRLASVTGTFCYVFSAGALLRLQQSDLTFAILTAIPLLLLLIYHSAKRFSWWNTLGQFFVLSALAWFTFLQEAAYAYLLAFSYAGCLAWRQRAFHIILTTGSICLMAAVSALPRFLMIFQDLAQTQRLNAATRTSFDQIYASQNIRPYEILRWFHEGIFGRFSSEAWSLGNNINLSEGCLLFASLLIPFLVLGGIVLATVSLFQKKTVNGKTFQTIWNQRDGWFHAGILFFCLCVLLFKPVNCLLYLLFSKLDFTHTRILIVGLLPQAVLVSVAVDFLRHRCSSSTLPVSVKFSSGIVLLGAFLGVLASLWWHWDPAGLSKFGQNFDHRRSQFIIDAVRKTPDVIHISWFPRTVDEEIIVELKDGDGDWRQTGEAARQMWQYLVGKIEKVKEPFIRLSLKQTGKKPQILGTVKVRETTFWDRLQYKLSLLPIRIATAPIFHFIFVFIGWSILLIIFWIFPKRPLVRISLPLLLSGFICGDTWGYAWFQLHGQHTQTTLPCYLGNHWYPTPQYFSPPNEQERQWWRQKLESESFRSIALWDPKQFFGYHTNAASMFLDGKFLDGYSSTVPLHLSQLPWPPGVLGLRTLSFTNISQVEESWPLLTRQRVKYVVILKPQFYSRISTPQMRAEVIQNPMIP